MCAPTEFVATSEVIVNGIYLGVIVLIAVVNRAGGVVVVIPVIGSCDTGIVAGASLVQIDSMKVEVLSLWAGPVVG